MLATALDYDEPGTDNSIVSYTLTEGADKFTINPDTGLVATRELFDILQQDTYTIKVEAQDRGTPVRPREYNTLVV